MKSFRLMACTLALLALGACTAPGRPATPSTSDLVAAVRCSSPVANAFYAGPYRGTDDRLPVEDLVTDLVCASKFKQKYPSGFVAIYGSSRIAAQNKPPRAEYGPANDQIHAEVYRFARHWTETQGKRWPILSGGGTGLMAAAGAGAVDAGGASIGYTTYYGDSRDNGGQPAKAFSTRTRPDGTQQDLFTDGLIFSSVGIREYAMFLHSSVVVLAPGGSGTEWEIFQILESIKSGQLGPVPVYLLGPVAPHWTSLLDRIRSMEERGTVSKGQLQALFVQVNSADELFDRIAADFVARQPR